MKIKIPEECREKNKIKILPCYALELCETCKFNLREAKKRLTLTKDTENELVDKFLKKKEKK